MTVGVVVSFSVQPEQLPGLKRLVEHIADEVLRAEPECLVYRLMKLREPESRWKLIEIYSDQEAFDRHMSAPYVTSNLSELLHYLGDAPEVEFLFDG